MAALSTCWFDTCQAPSRAVPVDRGTLRAFRLLTAERQSCRAPGRRIHGGELCVSELLGTSITSTPANAARSMVSREMPGTNTLIERYTPVDPDVVNQPASRRHSTTVFGAARGSALVAGTTMREVARGPFQFSSREGCLRYNCIRTQHGGSSHHLHVDTRRAPRPA